MTADERDPVSILLGRNGVVTQRVARDLLRTKPPSRIKTVGEYAGYLSAGHGTVHKALRTLEDIGAVRTEARGHLGTFVIERDRGLLWALSGLGDIVGALPLPDTPEQEGLATALVDLLATAEMPANLTHISGSRRRVAQLEAGRVDFALMSLYAAQQLGANHAQSVRGFTQLRGYEPEHPHLDLGVVCEPYTFYARDSLRILADRSISSVSDIRRVGIDETSVDHSALTRLFFDDGGLEFVQVPYHRLPDVVCSGVVDAAVWHRTTQRGATDPRLRLLELDNPSASRTLPDLTSAALLVNRRRPMIGALLADVLDAGRITAIQAEVMNGSRLPMF